jgi:hypothetical protein
MTRSGCGSVFKGRLPALLISLNEVGTGFRPRISPLCLAVNEVIPPEAQVDPNL